MKLCNDDEDIATFRSLNIKLVKEQTNYKCIVNRLTDRYGYIQEAYDIINRLNKDLTKLYKGNYKYDFCIDEGINIHDLKIKDRYKKRLSLKCNISNHDLAILKKRFEICLNDLHSSI